MPGPTNGPPSDCQHRWSSGVCLNCGTNQPQPITTVGPPPTVTEHNGQLAVSWPDGREETFIMRTTLFEAMVLDINAAKRIATTLDQIRATLAALT